MTVVELAICDRQSPAGKAVSFATHTSILAPTARKV